MIGFLGIGKHLRVRGRLSAYIDGQVSRTESRRVEEHMDLCDECRLELDTLRSTVDLLNRLPELAVPRSFALSEAPASVVSSFPFTSAARLVAPVAAAVLVMLVVGDAPEIVSQSDLGEPPTTSSVAEPAVVIEKEVVKEVAVAVEKMVEVETTMESEVEEKVAEQAVKAAAVAEVEAAEEPVEEPGNRRSADAPEAPPGAAPRAAPARGAVGRTESAGCRGPAGRRARCGYPRSHRGDCGEGRQRSGPRRGV